MASRIHKALFAFLGLAAVSAVLILSSGQKAGAESTDFSEAQKTQIQQIIAEYVNENPQIIIDALNNYREQQEADQRAQATQTLKDNVAFLSGPDLPSIGNPDADVTVVEFFDYNCGYCKRAVPDIQALIKEDKNVRFVFKDMPILGPTSHTAAQWALAAHKQGKYFEYHVALMEHRGNKEEGELAKLAEDLGLDVEQMKKDAASEETQQILAKNMEITQKAGINGTPAFIIGDTLYPGYLGPDGLKDAIEESRNKNDG